jgi:hypothetical protein
MWIDSVCVFYHLKYLMDVGVIGDLVCTTIYLVK